MPLQTFIPPINPSPGMTIAPELKLFNAEFGDGYTQNTPAGLNHIRNVLDVNWEVLTADQRSTIISFFVARKGTEPFYWTPPGEAAAKWTCAEWQTTALGSTSGNALFSVTAKFRQNFGNAT